MITWRIALVAVALASTAVMSQERLAPLEAELHRRLDAAVVRTDPAWHQEYSRPRHASAPFSATMWRRGDTTVGIHHYPHETEEEASQRARRLVETLPVPFRPVSGYGDEAYLVAGPSILSTSLVMRKGTTVLNIGSLDGSAVLKFATELVREIERAQRDGIVR